MKRASFLLLLRAIDGDSALGPLGVVALRLQIYTMLKQTLATSTFCPSHFAACVLKMHTVIY